MNSSVGKKVLMALSGIALMLFLIVHLGGNLTLFAGREGALFNSYAHHLESLGPLLYVAEAGLLAIFLLHVFTAFGVTLDKKRARPDGYTFLLGGLATSRLVGNNRFVLMRVSSSGNRLSVIGCCSIRHRSP